MTICIIALLGGRTKEEWYQWVKERVDNKVGWDTPESIAPVFNSPPRQANNGGGGGGGGGPGGINSGNVLQALASGLAGVGGQGGEGQDGSGGNGGLRLAPGGLAAALGGGRFVLRPGEPDEKGEMTYEAHVVDEDDSEDGDEDEEDEEQGSSSSSKSGGQGSESERPALTHQPEIVETPGHAAQEGKGNTGTTNFTRGGSDVSSTSSKGDGMSASPVTPTKPQVEVRPSTEGTGAEQQQRAQGSDKMEL